MQRFKNNKFKQIQQDNDESKVQQQNQLQHEHHHEHGHEHEQKQNNQIAQTQLQVMSSSQTQHPHPHSHSHEQQQQSPQHQQQQNDKLPYIKNIIIIILVLICAYFGANYATKMYQNQWNYQQQQEDQQDTIKYIVNSQDIFMKKSGLTQDNRVKIIQDNPQLIQRLKNQYSLYSNQKPKLLSKSLYQYTRQAISAIKPSYKYLSLQNYTYQNNNNLKQLQLCIIVDQSQSQNALENDQSYNKIVQSIIAQNYKNQKTIKISNSVSQNYYINLESQITKQCKKNQLLIFVSSPIKQGALHKINVMFQIQNIWLLVDVQNNQNDGKIDENQKQIQNQRKTCVRVLAVYKSVFDKIKQNDVQGSNIQLMMQINNKGKQSNKNMQNGLSRSILALGLIQLSALHTKTSKSSQLFSQNLKFTKNDIKSDKYVEQIQIQRIPYRPLRYLSQPPNPQHSQLQSQQQSSGRKPFPSPSPQSHPQYSINSLLYRLQYQNTTLNNYIIAEQKSNIHYLPPSHLLISEQLRQYEQKYGENQRQFYSYRENQICVTVLSNYNYYDYDDQEGVIRTLRSVFQQNYTNYRIVLFYTNNNNRHKHNLKQSIKQLLSHYPHINTHSITLIYNLKQNPSLYNIFQSAHTKCRSSKYQLPIYSGDELIGRNVLKLINFKFSIQENQVIVMNYMEQNHGIQPNHDINQFVRVYQKRQDKVKYQGYLGMHICWSIRFIRSIPQYYYKMLNKLPSPWFPTSSISTLLIPFLQLCYFQKITYINEQIYLKNNNNNNKLLLSQNSIKQLASRQILKNIVYQWYTIQDVFKVELTDLRGEFQKGQGWRYRVQQIN